MLDVAVKAYIINNVKNYMKLIYRGDCDLREFNYSRENICKALSDSKSIEYVLLMAALRTVTLVSVMESGFLGIAYL